MYAEERAAYISYLVNEWCVVIRGADACYHFGDEMIFEPPICSATANRVNIFFFVLAFLYRRFCVAYGVPD